MESTVSVLILAAGLGTRMKSSRAKVLHEVGGKPLIEHVVRSARMISGPERVAAVVGHQAEAVEAKLAGYGIRFVQQAEQLGTGHAVKVAREAVASTGLLVVLYGDTPLLSGAALSRLVEHQRGSGAAATVITTMLDDPTGYGRIVRDELGDVAGIVEQKAAGPKVLAIHEINSGIYCFRADLLWDHIGEITTDNPAGEYYLTDMVQILRRAGYRISALKLENSEELLGINTRVELAEVDRIFRARKARELMLDGVTIEKPETVTVDLDVEIGRDTIIEPFTRILGNTVIGQGCRIGMGAIVQDSRLEDEVVIHPYTIVNTTTMERGAHAGPYARLRLENHIAAGAHIGNFVELKKTRFGAGSKAMHLAYLGDSQIGADVNIGAGTITCNYDGEKKHPTTVGDGAFVGSNATLVAPVEIGAGSYVAAGSVITEAVPEKALGIGRGRQVNKIGWEKKQRD
jgi:bifunctional UDP-N-acetylglucosamine pyrophosphorylase/glucosamine-1-phosphate N-acetyltransferase